LKPISINETQPLVNVQDTPSQKNYSDSLDISLIPSSSYLSSDSHLLSSRDEILSSSSSSSSAQRFLLNDIYLFVPQNSLTIVIGTVGSGKSSLGLACLGELNIVSGNPSLETVSVSDDLNSVQDIPSKNNNGRSVRVSGRVAYYPQTPWIVSGSVKENIVLFGTGGVSDRGIKTLCLCMFCDYSQRCNYFWWKKNFFFFYLLGSPIDEQRYQEAVKVCCLEDDISMLSAGDEV
jgi:hypothetical protein